MIRQMEEKDLDRVMVLIRAAQKKMAEQNIDQWQNGYPNRLTFMEDIRERRAYVLEDDGKVESLATLFLEPDEDYENITQGTWKTQGKYGVIHRVCSGSARKGYMLKLFEMLFVLCIKAGCKSVRIDTHPDNLPMRKFLQKVQFKEVGIVYVQGKEKRLAYERAL